MLLSSAAPCTAARQLLCPWHLPGKDAGSALSFTSPGDLPDPGIEPMSPALAGESFTTEPLRKSFICSFIHLSTHPVHSSLYPSTHPPSIHLSKQSPILFNHPFINLTHSSIVHCGSTRHILPPSDPVSFLEVLLTHPSSQHPTHTSSSLPTYPSHTFTYCPLSTHQILSPIIFFSYHFLCN